MAFPGPPEPSALPEADWYPDPERPGRLRYWDGSDWTDHHVNESGAPTDIGDWLGRTFSVLWERKLSVLILTLLPVVLWIPALLLVRSGVSDARLDTSDAFGDSISTGPLVVAAIVAVAGIVLSAVSYLALAHQFFVGHQGGSATVGSSLMRAAARLPVTCLWALALYVPMFIAFGLIFAAAAQAPSLLLIALPLFFAAFIWLYVRFGFIVVSAVVAPKAGQILTASMQVSKGYFWRILGRLILVALIGVVIGFVVQMVVQQVLLAGTIGSFEFEYGEGEFGRTIEGVLHDGKPVGDQPLGDLLPGVIGSAVFGVLYYLSNVVGSILSLSGVAGLYSDARAPSITEAERVL